MKKTKLTELLSSFSTAEIKRFNIFLNSPYFNTKPQFIRLFEAIIKHHPYYEKEKLTEEKVFAESFPGKAYRYTIFKNSLSDLYELAKTFLSYEEISDDKLILKNYFMQNLIRKNNINNLIDKEINISEQLYDKEVLSPAYFEYNYLFKKTLCKYYSYHERDKYNESSDNEIESFYSMVLYNLLTYGMFFEATTVNAKPSGDAETVFELIETLYNIDKVKKPVNQIFYKTLQLLKTDDDKYYYEIREMLKNENDFLNNSSKLWVYQPMEAFLIKRVRNGEKQFYRPQFEMYKHCFETGVYDKDYTVAQTKLIMTVETAVRVKELDWIEQQINKYKNLGPKEIRDDYYNFNMSKVYQAKGENDKALELLNKINMDVFELKSMVRNMQMKIYYELGYYELAKSQIDSYRHYITREKEFSQVYVESVNNFLKLYNRLIDLKIDGGTEKLYDFEYDINKTKHIILREWLKEKTSELKKGAK